MPNSILTQDPVLAAEYILQGKLVIFPTETVFGIGASALDRDSCERIYVVKNRPKDNPFILHIDCVEKLNRYGYISPNYIHVVQKFSPGPITYILKKKMTSLYSSGLDTIGIRIPDHPVAQLMLRACDIPVAAPSANLSTRPSITRIEDIVETFSQKVDLILEGDCEVGIESTVIDLSTNPPIYLRPGKITYEELLHHFPDMIKFNSTSIDSSPISPGLKYRHYSPDSEVILVDSLANINQKLEFGQIGFNHFYDSNLSIKVIDNLDYMKKLFAFFIDCDKKKLKRAYCQIPQSGIGYDALMNRILKASSK